MALAARIHQLLGAAEAVDRLGDETVRPHLAGVLDLLVAIAADALGLAQDARIGFGELLVDEQRARRRHLAARQIDRRRGRPVLAEQLLDRADGEARALDQRLAFSGVVDRGLEHVGERHGAVVAQQQHPGLERAGHAAGEQPGAGHEIEAEALIVRDGRAHRRRTLAADHLDLVFALARVVHDDRHVAAGAVEMRLDHLQRERGRHRRVEGVAAALQDAHADRGRDPVRGGADAEGAVDLGPRGEGIGIDVAHMGFLGGLCGFGSPNHMRAVWVGSPAIWGLRMAQRPQQARQRLPERMFTAA